MSVLSDSDRETVVVAIRRARTPRRRTDRSAWVRVNRRPKVEKPEPLLFVGLCSWCGSPATFGSAACEGHEDLLDLDDATSAVVTRNTTGRPAHSLEGTTRRTARKEPS